MLAGIPPFFDETPYGIYQQIIKGKLKFPRSFDAKAADLVSGLLTMDPTRRLGERPPVLPPHPPIERVAVGPRCWQRNPFPRPARRGVRPGCPLPPAPLCPSAACCRTAPPNVFAPLSSPGARRPHPRAGCLRAGAADVKAHRFFSRLDWRALASCAVEPPFVPDIRTDGDTVNFPEDYPDSDDEARMPSSAEQAAFRAFDEF